MNDKRLHAIPTAGNPITEADLHAYADGQLPPGRHAEVDAFLAAHPQDLARVHAWQAQRRALHALLDPVLDEPLPLRLPLSPPARRLPWRAVAACAAIAVISASSAWMARGAMDARHLQTVLATAIPDRAAGGYAQRAAIAHAVYAPDMGRPVEVSGDNKRPWSPGSPSASAPPCAPRPLPMPATTSSAAASCPAAAAPSPSSCTAPPTANA